MAVCGDILLTIEASSRKGESSFW